MRVSALRHDSLYFEGAVVTALLSAVALVPALLRAGSAPSALSDMANPPFCDISEASVGLDPHQYEQSTDIKCQGRDSDGLWMAQQECRNKPFVSFLWAENSSSATSTSVSWDGSLA